MVQGEQSRSKDITLGNPVGRKVQLVLVRLLLKLFFRFTGTPQIMAHMRKFRRPPICLSIGPPFRVQSSSGTRRLSREALSLATEQMMYRLAAQLPLEFRGVYHEAKMSAETYLFPVDI